MNGKTKVEWECGQGHRWWATQNNVQRGTWCPHCGRSARVKLPINDPHTLAPHEKRKLRLDEMMALARTNGGKCLAIDYMNSRARIEWECGQGHKWAARPDSIQHGRWCPTCARNYSKKIDEMRALAKERGGRCLSDEYCGAVKKLHWQCKGGHQWWADPHSVLRGSWCIICAGYARKTITDMQEYAKSKVGLCVSAEYKNAMTPLLWQCMFGHQWWGKPNSVRSRDGWCPTCQGRRKTVADMQTVATSRGGRFCSETYRGDARNHTWQCVEGHQWEATPNRILRGGWCPVCSKGVSERTVRFLFEKLFQRPFPTLKPKWLINRRGARMELDGFCAELGLAFEYQGIQHFQFNKRFHNDKEEFIRRVEDDRTKRELCEEHGVKLIVLTHEIPLSDMENKIFEECTRLNVTVDTTSNKIILNSAHLRRNIERMQRWAQKRGGLCLSEAYIDAFTKLQWQCAKGHEWWAKPNSIQQGGWCAECAGTKRKSMNEMQRIAEAKGGKCLSSAYLNQGQRLLWECAERHQFEMPYKQVRVGQWCPVCRKQKKSFSKAALFQSRVS